MSLTSFAPAPLRIGPYTLPSPVLLAPMAGVTDLPYRQLVNRLGAGLVTSEMLTADTRLWESRKSRTRLQFDPDIQPCSVQLAGADPSMLASAASLVVDRGAKIIDINMGCPAKKVCRTAAGSALLQDEARVAEILFAVAQAVSVPVTLKIRTGWNLENRNAVRIARIAEDVGIAALTIHGRTRACAFKGDVEYDTIAEVASKTSIPVIVNGDIDSAIKAKEVMAYTGADGVMIGRAALGQPWILRHVSQYLTNGIQLPQPNVQNVCKLMLEHVVSLHSFYGPQHGVRIARKHVGWYLQRLSDDLSNGGGGVINLASALGYRTVFNSLETAEGQIESLIKFKHSQNETGGELAA